MTQIFVTYISHQFLVASFITSLQSHLRTALTTQNTTGGKKCIMALTEHDSTTVQCIFKWNTSFIGHKQWTVVFTQRKPLQRSTANSTVSNSNSGALSVLLFHVNYFTLTNCPNFSTKNVSSGHIRSELWWKPAVIRH